MQNILIAEVASRLINSGTSTAAHYSNLNMCGRCTNYARYNMHYVYMYVHVQPLYVRPYLKLHRRDKFFFALIF